MERVAWDTHLEETAEQQRKSDAEAAQRRRWAESSARAKERLEQQRLEREQQRHDSPAPKKRPGQGPKR